MQMDQLIPLSSAGEWCVCSIQRILTSRLNSVCCSVLFILFLLPHAWIVSLPVFSWSEALSTEFLCTDTSSRLIHLPMNLVESLYTCSLGRRSSWSLCPDFICSTRFSFFHFLTFGHYLRIFTHVHHEQMERGFPMSPSKSPPLSTNITRRREPLIGTSSSFH